MFFCEKFAIFRTMEVSKAFFGTKCLNIFASGCPVYARQKKDILFYRLRLKSHQLELFGGAFQKK